MFTSKAPGNGKTFQANKFIMENSKKPQIRQILLSGEVSEEKIKQKFRFLISSSIAEVGALFIKIEYLTNLERNKEFLNSFFFQLCYKGYISIQGEHFFLSNDTLLVFELASYSKNFLLNGLSFFKSLKIVNCEFSFDTFEFSQNVFAEEQIVGFGLKHLLIDSSYEVVDYAKMLRTATKRTKKQILKIHTLYQLKR